MPLYEYRCRACGATFDRLRSVDEADDRAVCGDGHDDTVRLMSRIAAPPTSSVEPGSIDPGSMPGGCCGGTCCG